MDNNMSCGMGIQNLESRCFFSIFLYSIVAPYSLALKNRQTHKLLQNSALGFHVFYILSKLFKSFSHLSLSYAS